MPPVPFRNKPSVVTVPVYRVNGQGILAVMGQGVSIILRPGPSLSLYRSCLSPCLPPIPFSSPLLFLFFSSLGLRSFAPDSSPLLANFSSRSVIFWKRDIEIIKDERVLIRGEHIALIDDQTQICLVERGGDYRRYFRLQIIIIIPWRIIPWRERIPVSRDYAMTPFII